MIDLLVVGYVKNYRFYMKCLNTDVLVIADSFEEAKKRMIYTLILYFANFSHAEILAGKYIRKASIKYWIKYSLAAIRLSMINFSRLNVKYNINENNLRFI
ncbi:MAG: hypothetical protein P8Z35_02470 [Ignavibacteriaceae bacterium]